MKKVLFFGFVFFSLVFFASFSSALYKCDYSQQLYRLYTLNNSHVQLPSYYQSIDVRDFFVSSVQKTINYTSSYPDHVFCGDVGNIKETANFICSHINNSWDGGMIKYALGNFSNSSYCAYYNSSANWNLTGNKIDTKILTGIICNESIVSSITGCYLRPGKTEPSGGNCSTHNKNSCDGHPEKCEWKTQTVVNQINHSITISKVEEIFDSTTFGGNYFCGNLGDDVNETARYICSKVNSSWTGKIVNRTLSDLPTITNKCVYANASGLQEGNTNMNSSNKMFTNVKCSTIEKSCVKNESGTGQVKVCSEATNQTQCQNATYKNYCKWDFSKPKDIYPIDVCYNEIFGFNFSDSSISDPHDASYCDYPLFWVSNLAKTNSHASNVNYSIYQTPVCFAGLNCSYESLGVGNNCTNPQAKVVARLYNYSANNSHVNYNVTSNYNGKVCCAPYRAIRGVNWTDMNGEPIEEADLGDSVKMGVYGFGLFNSTINYSIYKESEFWIFKWDKKIADIRVSDSDKSRFGMWVANETGNYTFKASFEDGMGLKQSGKLFVNNTKRNTPAVVYIGNPECGKIIGAVGSPSANGSLNFYIDDEDNEINGTITLEVAGIKEAEINFSNIDFDNTRNIQFNYTFLNDGQVLVTLYYQYFDNLLNGTAQKRLYSNAIVYNSSKIGTKYVAACIDSPEDMSNIPNATVQFDARKTNACKVQNNGCDNGTSAIPPSEISFRWRFSDGTTHVGNAVIGSNVPGNYFIHVFPKAGNNNATLNVSV